jgi:hypothetical protein
MQSETVLEDLTHPSVNDEDELTERTRCPILKIRACMNIGNE